MADIEAKRVVGDPRIQQLAERASDLLRTTFEQGLDIQALQEQMIQLFLTAGWDSRDSDWLDSNPYVSTSHYLLTEIYETCALDQMMRGITAGLDGNPQLRDALVGWFTPEEISGTSPFAKKLREAVKEGGISRDVWMPR